jgi:hypothetical protein
MISEQRRRAVLPACCINVLGGQPECASPCMLHQRFRGAARMCFSLRVNACFPHEFPRVQKRDPASKQAKQMYEMSENHKKITIFEGRRTPKEAHFRKIRFSRIKMRGVLCILIRSTPGSKRDPARFPIFTP